MTIFDIPFINGYKSAIGGYGLLLSGIAGLLSVIAGCLTGDLTIAVCIQGVQDAMIPLAASFGGISVIGVAHKIEKTAE